MKKFPKQGVAFIIPAYNEALVIGSVISDLKRALEETTYRSQVIVVDDGSKDSTAEIAKRAGAHVIQHVLNSGSGSATATGLSYAQQKNYTVAATLDADGQHKISDVLNGIEIILKNSDIDLLIGSRLIDANGMSRIKIVGNKGLSFITYILFGVNVTDSQSGLRIFSKLALDTLTWRTSGYEFCSEMLWRAKQQKLNIQEYPIEAIYTDYSKAKGQNNWNAVNIVRSLLQRRIMEMFSE